MRRVLEGFSKCAMVAAHYAMSDVLDNLVISLTKFTTLLHNTAHDSQDSFKIAYGANSKALLATRAVFSLIHKASYQETHTEVQDRLDYCVYARALTVY